MAYNDIAIEHLRIALNDIIMNDFEEPEIDLQTRMEYARKILRAIKIAGNIGDKMPDWCAKGVVAMVTRFWENPDRPGCDILGGILEMLKACL